MPIRNLVYADNDRLRQKAEYVTQVSALYPLIDDMIETMQAHNGVGLAAPQIGVSQRLFVAHIPAPNQEDEPPIHPEAGKTLVMINPKIVDHASSLAEGEEGCLSIPGWRGLVNRPEWVDIEAESPKGEQIQLRADGYLARIFMHETDHLNGVLFTDYIEDKSELWQVDDNSDRTIELDDILPAQQG